MFHAPPTKDRYVLTSFRDPTAVRCRRRQRADVPGRDVAAALVRAPVQAHDEADRQHVSKVNAAARALSSTTAERRPRRSMKKQDAVS